MRAPGGRNPGRAGFAILKLQGAAPPVTGDTHTSERGYVLLLHHEQHPIVIVSFNVIDWNFKFCQQFGKDTIVNIVFQNGDIAALQIKKRLDF